MCAPVHMCECMSAYECLCRGGEGKKDFLGCMTGSVELKGRSWCGQSPFESLGGEGESGNRTGWRGKSLQRRVRKISFCRENRGGERKVGTLRSKIPTTYLPWCPHSMHADHHDPVCPSVITRLCAGRKFRCMLVPRSQPSALSLFCSYDYENCLY